MPTLQITSSPSPRIAMGSAILEAAQAVETAPIKAKLAAFAKAQKDYVAAAERVRKAEDKAAAAQATVGARDADLDALVEELASALAGEGLPRANPFKPFGAAAPSKVTQLRQAEEPKVVRKLVAAVRKSKGRGKATLGLLPRLEKACAAVEAALPAVAAAGAALSGAIAQREALALPWEKAFSSLKRAARVADDDGAKGLFEALFQRTAKPNGGKGKPQKGGGGKQGPEAGGGAESGAPPA